MVHVVCVYVCGMHVCGMSCMNVYGMYMVCEVCVCLCMYGGVCGYGAYGVYMSVVYTCVWFVDVCVCVVCICMCVWCVCCVHVSPLNVVEQIVSGFMVSLELEKTGQVIFSRMGLSRVSIHTSCPLPLSQILP